MIHSSLKVGTTPCPNQMYPICTTEHRSVLQRKAILTPATTWMNLEDVLLSEIRQAQKDKGCRILLYEAPRVVRVIETKSRKPGARGLGRGMGC